MNASPIHTVESPPLRHLLAAAGIKCSSARRRIRREPRTMARPRKLNGLAGVEVTYIEPELMTPEIAELFGL